MGHSQADKSASHDRILTIAATRLREAGLDGLSVADLMAEAGLTHGGFYRHFANRDALVAEALGRALAQSRAKAAAWRDLPPGEALAALVDAYLSPEHRDDPGDGCAMAALGNDVARASPAARARYSQGVAQTLAALERTLAARAPDAEGDAAARAAATLSALVGAIVLARAVSDPALSARLLEQTARVLKGQGLPERPPPVG